MNASRTLLLIGLVQLFSLTGSAQADSAAPPSSSTSATQESRGTMLYDLHCSACHAKEVHWRAQRKVTNMSNLQHEVRRWNENVEARWNEADLREVIRYLNTTFYHFPTD